MTTLPEALVCLAGRLRATGVPTPEVDAELLAAHVLGWSRSALRLRRADLLSPDVEAGLEAAGERRAAREPLQLIVGSVGFRHLDLLVRPGVFIPRPETEVLAGEAIARVPPGGVVVEPCTGTGAVACAVATEASPRLVVATDVSPAAVALARQNAARAGARAVRVLAGDLLEPVPAELRGAVDVLVANPPYLTPDQLVTAEPEVRDWDPPRALVSGPDGHEHAARLCAAAAQWLRPGGWLLLEVDPSRAQATAHLAETASLHDVRILPDLLGRPRIVTGQLSSACGGKL
ncbi:MAG: peptide chain release factor N(5)-glutamine methyltransferase [Egibacteraceae bacterium]